MKTLFRKENGMPAFAGMTVCVGGGCDSRGGNNPPPAQLTLEAVFNAYFDCRRNKRNAESQLAFEVDLEKNLVRLWRELVDGTYEIGPSIAFVVKYPKVREVWAASFRDRIVHHLIYNAVKDRYYARFIRDTYACIPGRGLHDGLQRVSGFARSATRNGSREAFVLKADVANFFTSINQNIAVELFERRVSEEWVRKLLRQVVFHDPRPTAHLQSSQELFDKVPRHKSLMLAPRGFGLPIGNLTSQFLANLYLNELDQFAKHELKAIHYGRYMDDIVVFGQDPVWLNDIYERMEAFVRERLGIRFHPNKKSVQPVHRGFRFTGFVVKPGRTHLRPGTLDRARAKIVAWEEAGRPIDKNSLSALSSSVTSYLAMLRRVSGFRERQSLCRFAASLFIYPDADFTKLICPQTKAGTRPINMNIPQVADVGKRSA